MRDVKYDMKHVSIVMMAFSQVDDELEAAEGWLGLYHLTENFVATASEHSLLMERIQRVHHVSEQNMMRVHRMHAGAFGCNSANQNEMFEFSYSLHLSETKPELVTVQPKLFSSF